MRDIPVIERRARCGPRTYTFYSHLYSTRDVLGLRLELEVTLDHKVVSWIAVIVSSLQRLFMQLTNLSLMLLLHNFLMGCCQHDCVVLLYIHFVINPLLVVSVSKFLLVCFV